VSIRIRALLSAVISGDRAAAAALGHFDPEAIRRVARRHGVLPLVADRCASWDAAGPVADLLRSDAMAHAAADLVREVELGRVLDGLAAADVDVLLLKGAQLAYTHYMRPDLRPRADTDLLVRAGARGAAHDALVALGYDAPAQVSGDFVTHQAFYARHRQGVAVHGVDLHWRIANPQLFARLLTFQELWSTAVPIPALGTTARGLSSVHALLLACVHRVAHHYDDDCLIWLFDIHRIASRLSAGEWETFLSLADARDVMTICRQGLDRAEGEFGPALPASLRQDGRLGRRETEATATFLTRDRAQLENLASDLRALESWSDRWRLVREHLFPPSQYMRDVYAPSSRAPLALLYARRAVLGARKWLTRSPLP
jgi:hypothetical protein